MKITFTPTPADPPKSKYPYFGLATQGKSLIVLFTDKDTGIVVAQGTSMFQPGYRTDNGWVEEHFIPFYGTITIERD